jgi:hypothetical protein
VEALKHWGVSPATRPMNPRPCRKLGLAAFFGLLSVNSELPNKRRNLIYRIASGIMTFATNDEP